MIAWAAWLFMWHEVGEAVAVAAGWSQRLVCHAPGCLQLACEGRTAEAGARAWWFCAAHGGDVAAKAGADAFHATGEGGRLYADEVWRWVHAYTGEVGPLADRRNYR